MKKIIVGVLGVMILAPSAIAEDITRIRLDSANVPEIGLAQGSGVNITFIPAGRIIQKVWLDDPTWIVFDVDGCLVGQTTKCERPTATTVHLKRINPLRIQGMFSTGRSLLTVVTSGEAGDLKISTFRIVPRGSPGVSIVEVMPTERREQRETTTCFLLPVPALFSLSCEKNDETTSHI
jgi:hypothetical protein